jgi:hypothetical protein
MAEPRDIDERDVDKLLALLTNVQIANLYGMTLDQVMSLRRLRRSHKPPLTKAPKDKDEPGP